MKFPPPPPAEDDQPLPDPVPAATHLHPALALAYNAGFWSYFVGSAAALFLPAVGIWAATARSDPRKRMLARYTSRWGAHYLASAPMAGVHVMGRDTVDE